METFAEARTPGGGVRTLKDGRQVLLWRWVAALVALDLLAAIVGAMVALMLRFGEHPGSVSGVSYGLLATLFPPAWIMFMGLGGTYQRGNLAAGAEEFRGVLNGAVWLLAVIALVAFAARAELSRGLIFVCLPLVTVLTLSGRYGARKALHRQVMGGRPLHRVLAVGGEREVMGLVRHMSRQPHVGFSVVGAWLPTNETLSELDGLHIPVVEHDKGMLDGVQALDADTIAIAGAAVLRTFNLRQLSWELEGTGISLVVAPAITDVAGPRIRVRPVYGLPLLHVDEPRFSGSQRVVKEIFDLVAAASLLLMLSPLLVAISILIKLTSRGPVIFRQERIGRHGEHISMFKFRTMRVGAHHMQASLSHLNDHVGLMFKMKDDPRVTRLGRWLRRYSLDELPQLWNVLLGTMSLVGPRPPLSAEVDRYEEHMRRRLLVKPGMTGLWQVSGRSNTSWDETVRLDLYYVEHWSMVLDIMVLWKTLGAVIRPRGAY